MKGASVTAGLIILLSLSVTGTALLAYWYALTLGAINKTSERFARIEETRARSQALAREATEFGRTHPEILTLLEAYGYVRVHDVLSDDAIEEEVE
jgi:hypothetical protein